MVCFFQCHGLTLEPSAPVIMNGIHETEYPNNYSYSVSFLAKKVESFDQEIK
jgi:hypothetical protein